MTLNFKWTPRIFKGDKPMTLAELKRKIEAGMQIRLVRGPYGPCDQMRVVVSKNSVGFAMEGEGVPQKKGPMHFDWPKAKGFKETESGFSSYMAPTTLEYQWVDPINPTPKDRATTFMLNTLELCQDDTEAVLALGDEIGNHEAAAETIRQWRMLKPELQRAFLLPEVCDRGIRQWLNSCFDWTYVPQTIDA